MIRASILFIIAHDWSLIARCYGNEVIKTPNVDALPERGVVFDYAFCTSPSCVPRHPRVADPRVHAVHAEDPEGTRVRDRLHR